MGRSKGGAGGDVCSAEAKTLKVPTLVLGGERDPITPPVHAQWFADNVPGAQLYLYPEGKHNIHMKYADDFNARVSAFFLGESTPKST
jgi:valacyclovir hydrolase